MDIDTRLIHAGRLTAARTGSVNPPLVRASTIVFPSLAEFKNSYEGVVFESLRYGRSGTSTNFDLQEAFAQIAGAESCIATASGLSAVAAVLGAHAGPGRQILVSDGVYGPTRVLCETELASLGTKVTFFRTADDLARLINTMTSLVYVEVPSSLTMQMLDVQAICAESHKRGIPVACDSTWGTPIFFNAHALGIDISVHAAAKFINGHSDTMLGLITGARSQLVATRAWCDRYGSHASADSCWLTLRGLRTLAVRMQRHEANARWVAGWLTAHPRVKRVLFPVLPADPGHELWKRQFSGGAGPFTFELHPCNETAFAKFIDGLQLFGLGTGWGGFESLVMPALPHRLRSAKQQPDDGRLVRLHVGLENVDDLCADLAQAFHGM